MPNIAGNKKLAKVRSNLISVGFGGTTTSKPGHPGAPIFKRPVLKLHKKGSGIPVGKIITVPSKPVAKKVIPITKAKTKPAASASANVHIANTSIGRVILLVIVLALVIHFVRK